MGVNLAAKTTPVAVGVESLSAGGKLTQDMDRRRSYAEGAFGNWRIEIRKLYRAYGGDPWPIEDKDKMDSEGRLRPNLNYMAKTINAIIGNDQSDRKEVRFQGITKEAHDSAVAEWLTTLVRHQFNRSRGHRIDSHVLLDLLVTGYGWGRVYIDNTRFPFRIASGHVDPWEMYPDPDAKADNLTDAKWLIRKFRMARAEVKAKWPKKYPLLSELAIDGDFSTTSSFPVTVVADDYQGGHQGSGAYPTGRDVMEVIEYQYITTESWVAFDNPETGETGVTLPYEDFAALEAAWLEAKDEMGTPLYPEVQGVVFPKDVYKRAFFAGAAGGGAVLLEDKVLEIDSFSYVCATGLRDKNTQTGRTTFWGLARLAYDPQLLSSKGTALLIEMMAKQVKGGAWVEDDATDDWDELQEQWARPGSLKRVAPGAIDGGKIKEAGFGQWPAAMDQFSKLMINAVADVTGVSPYVTGTAQQERSNVLVSNLQQQSLTALNPILDPMAGYRMEMGQAMGKLVLAYSTNDTINRILGNPLIRDLTAVPDQMTGKLVPMMQPDPSGAMQMNPETGVEEPVMVPYPTAADILREVRLMDFDVEVDTGSASPTAKQAFWRSMVDTALLQHLMESGADVRSIIPDFIRYSPLPPEMSEQLAVKLEEAMAAPNPQEMLAKLQQMDPQSLQMIYEQLTQMMQGQQPQQEPQG